MTELGPGPIEASYWVQDGFLAGAYPGGFGARDLRQRLHRLLQMGITFFLDLTEPGEKGLPPYDALLAQEARDMGGTAHYARVPVPDFEMPSVAQMRRILDLLDRTLAQGRKIYLHCYAGVGRTGTVVGCFLVRHGWSGEQALDEIAFLRRGLDRDGDGPRSPITFGQRATVRSWAAFDRP